MKEIKLTQGYVALVDDEDFARVSQYRWHARIEQRKDGSIRTVYAGRNIRKEDGTRGAQLLHNFILGVLNLDHKDHDGLNNQRHNLRTSTISQNNQNTRKYANNTSGFKGVYYRERRRAWEVYIRINKKLKFVGYFTDLLEAARAYDVAAVK